MSLYKSLSLVLFFLFISCEEVINEADISNEVIKLLAPTDNVELHTNEKITFSWLGLPDADNYRLQISRPNFVNPLQIELDTLLTRIDFSVDSLRVNDYEWRVQGLNSVYETIYTTNSLKIEKPK